MNQPPAQPVQGLIDGLAVLHAIAVRREPVSSKALAEELGLEPTRTNRLLKTLAYLDIIHRTSDRRYVSGPGMHVLAAHSLFASGLIQNAMGPLGQLSKLKVTVAMGVLWRESVSYLYHCGPRQVPEEALGKTSLYPATRSAIGMVLLAEKEDAEVRDIYRGRDIPGYAGVRELLAALIAIRERGHAVIKQPRGNTGLGVKLGSPAYAALAISWKMNKEEAGRYVGALQDAAREIEQAGV